MNNIQSITLTEDQLKVTLTNIGATISSIQFPDKNGKMGELVIGFDELSKYLEPHPYIGSTVGRVANRISNAQFELAGRHYTLDKNHNGHHLHGGSNAMFQQLWHMEYDPIQNPKEVLMFYESMDGENGYPGHCRIETKFGLADNAITIEYKVVCDQDCPINLTHHDYFNLHDGGISDISSHVLRIYSDKYTPVNEEVIPNGQVKDVINTSYDFKSDVVLNTETHNYDVNYVINGKAGELRQAASLASPKSGRRLDVFTTQECMQLYTAHHLDGALSRNGNRFGAYAGICLETQGYPNAINEQNFPSNVLKAGEVYHHICQYRFSNF